MANHRVKCWRSDGDRGVTLEEFDHEWARCSGWLEAALEHARGTHLLCDVRQVVLSNPDVLFFPGHRSAMVVQIIRHPRLIQLHHWLCGGDLHELLDMLPAVEAQGVLRGCTLFTTGGDRPGWRRTLRSRGYSPQWEVLTKDLCS